MTATIAIGPLQPAHRFRLEEIVRATGVFSEDEVAVALELFDDTFTTERENGKSERVPISDYEFLGAFDGDRLIGYACFGPTPATDRTYDLYWIAVDPDAQRSGAGGALMDDVERHLDARRARMIVIETSSRDDYAGTRTFYQKRGYDESARLRDFYASGDDRIVLTKRVTPPRDGQGADSLPQ